MVEYNNHDVFYDYEVLQNVTTNAMLYPGSKKIVIPYNTHLNSVQPHDIKLKVTKEDERWIRDYVIEQNRSSLRRWGIPEENVQLTSDFVSEISRMDIANNGQIESLAHRKGTMFGFNSSGYDVAITAFLLEEIKKQQRSHRGDLSQICIDASNVRYFSDRLINGESRSPWKGIKEYEEGNNKNSRNLFGKFASLMNHPCNIDVQSLNAKMSKTSLKRLAAQGGFKIETSDKLSDKESTLYTTEELAELLAYNVNDIFATLWLFEQKPYQTPFNQRITLLDRYESNQFRGKNIKRDSTEAKLIENVISPRRRLEDDNKVSLAYPVTRGYMPEEEKDPDYSLGQANLIHAYLEQATEEKYPDSFEKNPDRTMNNYLREQYNKFKNTDPEHMIVKRFFFSNGQIKIISKKGRFAYIADSYEGFNYHMTKRLGHIIASSEKLQAFSKEEGLTIRDSDDLFQKAQPNNPTKERDWDHAVNEIISHINKNNPLYHWFYYKNGDRKVVAKDKRLMVDLLNFIDHNYDLPEDVRTYYNAYRGTDMRERDASRDVKKFLEDQGNKHLKTGAAVLLAPDTPIYVTMSIGGVHGNLIDLWKYKKDQHDVDMHNKKRKEIIDFYEEKVTQFNAKKYVELTGETTQQEQDKIYALLGKINEDSGDHTVAAVLARRTKRNGFVLGEPESIREADPHSFTTGTYKEAKFKKEKTTKALKTYTTTLYDTDVVHMDISSYYPTLISILQTLKSPDGEDRYDDLRRERVKLKERIPGDVASWTEQDAEDQAIQLANKLLLNAASGAADASYDNNIRVNNKAYRMRISGQLILLALSLDIAKHGGVPNSINTDGVYAHDIDEHTADRLIQSWASLYNLDADTEMVDLLISKDSNNRIEYYLSDKGETILASGGTVGNWEGTTLTGNLNRPPIIDRALTYYLIRHEEPLLSFDRSYVKDYIERFINERLDEAAKDPEAREELFNFFQTPLVSNASKHRYIVYQDTDGHWSYPNPVNRVFYTKEIPEAVQATMVVINKTIKKDDPEALRIATETDLLDQSGYENETNNGVHAGTMKITGVDTEQWFTIKNESTATIDLSLIDQLDIDTYVDSVKDQWDNWAI